MKKSTKIITTVVAIALVMTAMVVGIYAATAATSTINATVSWSATTGITFTLNGAVSGGNETPDALNQTVTSTTTNTEAVSTLGTLNTSFKDSSDDGVNNPSAIIYTYTIVSTNGSTFTVTTTTGPAAGAEGGTTVADHTPTVAYTGTLAGTALNATQITAIKPAGAGIAVGAGETLVITITLSLNPSGTGTINADTGMTSFNAGVVFHLA